MLHGVILELHLLQIRKHPLLTHLCLQDFVFDSGADLARVRVLGICDGHYGKGAAAYVSSHFISELQDRLSFDSHAGTSQVKLFPP